MHRNSILSTLIVLVMLVVIGCSKSSEDKQKQESSTTANETDEVMTESSENSGDDMATAMKQMQQTFGGGETVEPVDFRELKALLPASIAGMQRTNASGEKAGGFGVKVATAEGRYEADDGANITIKITDMGTMKGMAAMATYGWAMTEIDRETDTGYEKTMVFKGRKGYEKYDNDSQDGEITVMVADRFIVQIDGSQVKMDAIKAALNQVDLGKLEGMKDVGTK